MDMLIAILLSILIIWQKTDLGFIYLEIQIFVEEAFLEFSWICMWLGSRYIHLMEVAQWNGDI